jgi:hypothetical protein
MEEVTGGSRKWHKEELNNLFSSSVIVKGKVVAVLIYLSTAP